MVKTRTLRKYISKVYKYYVPWLLELEEDSFTLFRPDLQGYHDNDGSCPFVLMLEWEGQGMSYRRPCSNTKLLESLIQAKTLRDWHITEYKKSIREGLFIKEEFINAGDINLFNYKDILG